MKNLFKKSAKEIAEFLLNNKKGDLIEVSIDRADNFNSHDSFVSIVIYKDKYMEITYSYLIVEEDDIIEQFMIKSKWFGRIKNSFFSLEGITGKFDNFRCGIINLNYLSEYRYKNKVSVNNTNKIIKKENDVKNFSDFVRKVQKEHKASPKYEVIEVLSLPPKPWVRIRIELPNGHVYHSEGINKKEAANNFIRELQNQIMND